MAILTIYIDESYSHPPNPLVYTIAGYISEEWRWKKFEVEWDKVLKTEGVEYFHMREFAHNKGVYAGWTEKKRKKFLRTLHYITLSNTIKDFAVTVYVADYDRLIPPGTNLRFGMGEPHLFAVIGCMKNIGVWQRENNMDDPILYVFEKGTPHDKILKKVFNDLDEQQIDHYCVSGIDFKGKEVSPLQAADILAYENTVEMYRRVDPDRGRPIRESLKNLARPESDWGYYEESHITTVLENAERLGLVKVVTEET